MPVIEDAEVMPLFVTHERSFQLLLISILLQEQRYLEQTGYKRSVPRNYSNDASFQLKRLSHQCLNGVSEARCSLNLCTCSDVKILTVDNDHDSGALYKALFESNGATVMTTESVKEALDLLQQFVPDILVCEARFLGESVYPLIQRVRSIAQDSQKLIPICVTSTFPAINLDEYLKVKVEVYQIKPIDLDQLVAEVWNLVLPLKIIQILTTHSWQD